MPVRLQLFDGRVVAGEAYVALEGAGAHEHLLARLNDASEHFLPIATEGRHLLVRKASIVSAWTADVSELRAELEVFGLREIPVEVVTSRGPVIEGDLRAGCRLGMDRALDILNQLDMPFVALLARDAITLVNTAHIVAVVEQYAMS